MTLTKLLFEIYLPAVNLLAFLMYGIDKRRAVKGRFRISEKTLLLLGVFGGVLGGILGMKLFRHKTKHTYFWIVNILSLIVWILAIGAGLWYGVIIFEI